MPANSRWDLIRRLRVNKRFTDKRNQTTLRHTAISIYTAVLHDQLLNIEINTSYHVQHVHIEGKIIIIIIIIIITIIIIT